MYFCSWSNARFGELCARLPNSVIECDYGSGDENWLAENGSYRIRNIIDPIVKCSGSDAPPQYAALTANHCPAHKRETCQNVPARSSKTLI